MSLGNLEPSDLTKGNRRKMNSEELHNRFRSLSVLVCGDMCLDKNYIGGYSGFSRELEHLPIFRADVENCSPGGGGNLSVCFATLGVRTIVAGAWGGEEDFNRYILEREFRRRNIDVSGMVTGSRTPTFGKVYLRNGSHIYRLDLISSAISDLTVDQIVDKVVGILPSVDFVACADYEEATDYGVCSPKLLSVIAKSHLPKFGTSRKRIERFRGFNHLLLNTTELTEQSRLEKVADIPKIAEDFLKSLEADEVVVTMGGKGATAFQREQKGGLKAISVSSIELTENIDPCGCGDMFYAAYASSVMAGYDTETSLKLANAGARVVVRKRFGTGQATPEEIAREYQELYLG